jgi:NAD(P)-binding Rossmann-like domain
VRPPCRNHPAGRLRQGKGGCDGVGVPGRIETDYLVVGAGAMGMAFTDALVEHADVSVTLVDRRHGPGGHWLAAYPFVRLHQASSFYGVPSMVLGADELQPDGPEAGLHERATQPEIADYFARALARLESTGRVRLLAGCEYAGDGSVVSLESGRRWEVPEECRIVDARYVAPSIPAETPAPFDADDVSLVVPVNELAELDETPRQYVVVGSGKTATDTCIWLLGQGVDPDAICWVRPRDPWMQNRARIQPDPATFLGMVADVMLAAREAASAGELFVRLEELGVMVRIDETVTPTMAKAPTLATWELEQLRTIEHVVRRGHLRRVRRGELVLDEGSVAVRDDALVVHCAADGLKYPPLVPVWQPDMLRLQPIRAGYPCFGAGLAGYVEATRADAAEKNRLCPPTPFSDTVPSWARMIAAGARASAGFMSEPDIAEWANRVALNPARVPPGHPPSPELDDALARLAEHGPPGLERLERLGRTA